MRLTTKILIKIIILSLPDLSKHVCWKASVRDCLINKAFSLK